MLKRSDLAKQFELVVQQEIKNFQDSHNSVLQSIRDLAEEIALVKRDFLQCKAALHSEIGYLKSDFKINNDELCDLAKAFISSVNDQKQINLDVDRDLTALSNTCTRYDMAFDAQEKVNFELLHLINKDHENTKATHSNILTSLVQMELKNSKEIEKAKEDMEACPTKNNLVKEELEQKINMQNVDLEGLLKEIRIIGRAVLVTEKKIENIYTLIERMKKPKVAE